MKIVFFISVIFILIGCSTSKKRSDRYSYVAYPAIDFSDSICKVYFKKKHALTQSYKIVFENNSHSNLKMTNLASPFPSLTINFNTKNVSLGDTVEIKKKSKSEILLNYISDSMDEDKLEKYKFRYYHLLNPENKYKYRITLKVNLYDILLYRNDIFSSDTIKVEKEKFADSKNIFLYFKDVTPLDHASIFIDKFSNAPILTSKCVSTVDDLWFNIGLLENGIYQIKYSSNELFFFKTIEIK